MAAVLVPKRTVTPAFQVSVDALCEWELGEVTALAVQQGPPPYPAAPNCTPSLKSQESQFRHDRTKNMVLAYYNALAAGDTDTDVAV